MPLYRKKRMQEMIPYVKGQDTTGISISDTDRLFGSPKEGDMIAINRNNPNDRWLVAKAFFDENYELVEFHA